MTMAPKAHSLFFEHYSKFPWFKPWYRTVADLNTCERIYYNAIKYRLG